MPAMLVGGLRLAQGVLAVEEGPRSDLGLHLVDAFQAGTDQLDGGDAAVANGGGGITQSERTQAHAQSIVA
jgi:hypothetical protein